MRATMARPKPAARLATALVQPMEALQHGAPLRRRNARAAVADRQRQLVILALDAHWSPCRLRRVAHSVVTRLRIPDAQPFGLAGDDGWAGDSEAEIDVAGDDLRTEIGAHRFAQRRQVDRLWMGRPDSGSGRGQLQHLVDQAGGRLESGFCNCCSERSRSLAIAGALGDLQLGLQRSQRRAQFVGGIGGETALGVDGLFHALEQAVSGLDQRADLGRCAGRVGWPAAVADRGWRSGAPRHPARTGRAGLPARPTGRPAAGQRGREMIRRQAMWPIRSSRMWWFSLTWTCRLCSSFHWLKWRQWPSPCHGVSENPKPGSAGFPGHCSSASACRRPCQIWQRRRRWYLRWLRRDPRRLRPRVVAGQRQQRLGGLGELGVEQFIDLVVGVDVAENHGYQPGRRNAEQATGRATADAARTRWWSFWNGVADAAQGNGSACCPASCAGGGYTERIAVRFVAPAVERLFELAAG